MDSYDYLVGGGANHTVNGLGNIVPCTSCNGIEAVYTAPQISRIRSDDCAIMSMKAYGSTWVDIGDVYQLQSTRHTWYPQRW
ncbi:hypothetical protein D1872_256190 [compost metagenome]